MAIWAMADLHLSLGTDKPMDNFRGWYDYVNRIKLARKREAGGHRGYSGRLFMGH